MFCIFESLTQEGVEVVGPALVQASSASPSDSGVNSDNDSSGCGSRPHSGAGTAAAIAVPRFQLSQESLEIESVSRYELLVSHIRSQTGNCSRTCVVDTQH